MKLTSQRHPQQRSQRLFTRRSGARRLLFAGLLASAFVGSAAQACSPYGLVGKKWNELRGALGNCLSDEAGDGAGGRLQQFQHGWVSWDGHAPAAYAVYGSIGQKWAAMGGVGGLGHPTTDEQDSANRRGRFNDFDKGGSIVWLAGAPAAYAVYGDIRKVYLDEGREAGNLGFPVGDEQPLGANGDRVTRFEHGSIAWTKKNGATIVHVADSRITYRIPHIGFANGDPVGGGPIVLTVNRNGTYNFSGHFHDAAIVLDPVAETTNIVIAMKSSNGAHLYTFADSGSVSVTDRNHPWNTSGVNAELATGWADLERGVQIDWNASTRADLGKLWVDLQTAIGAAQKVVAVVGPLL